MKELPVFPGNKAGIVGIQFSHIALPPAAVEHIVRPVHVPEHELIDGLGVVVEGIDQGFAQVIAVRPARCIGYRHPDAAKVIYVVIRVVAARPRRPLHVIPPEKQVVLPVFFDRRRGPHGLPHPLHDAGIQNARVLFPVYQVLRRERIQKQLILEGRRVGWKHPVRIPENYSLGVGVPPFKDGVTGGFSSRIGGGGSGRRRAGASKTGK